MSSNTNIGNTPVNQGYVQLIHTGETGGIDGTLRTLYDGDGTASDLQIASNKVKVSTELYIGSKTATEFIQDIVGDMFTTGSYTNITTTYDDANGNIDLNATGAVSGITGGTGIDATGSGNITIAIDSTVTTLTGTQTLTNKTLTAPTLTGTTQGASITLSGDLTVNGTTTTVNQTNLDVSDNIIGLNRGASSNANDSGLIIERGSTGDNVFIGWDESADRVVFGVTSATPDSTGNLTIVNQPIQAARLYGDVTGNVTGSASLNLLISSNLSDLANAATARSNLGLGTLAELDSIQVANFLASAITTSSEAFADNDTTVMTSAAINDRIESFGYGVGDMTGVSITASNPLDISQSNTTSGDYSATISLDATEFQGYLTDMTDLIAAVDELLVIDSSDTTLKRKAINEIRLTAFDDTGFSSGISFNGSTANGLLTYGNSTTADVESDLVYNATGLGVGTTSPNHNLQIEGGSSESILNLTTTGNSNGLDVILGTDGHAAIWLRENDYMHFATNNTERMRIDSSGNIGIGTTSPAGKLEIKHTSATISDPHIAFEGSGGEADDFAIYAPSGENTLRFGYSGSGENTDILTIKRDSATSGSVGIGTTSPSVKLDVAGGDIAIDATQKLYFDGGGDTFIDEQSTNLLRFRVGNTNALKLSNTEAIINDPGGSFDFRVEGDTDQNLFFTDGSTDRVGIGTNSPAFKLDVSGDIRVSSGSLGVGVNPNATDGRGDFSNDVVAFSTSDKRLKENIKPLENSLDKVLKISGVEFDWKPLTKEKKKTIHGNEGHDVGVIAQEIEEVLPEVVTTRDSGYKAVKYEKIVPLLIEAIKEQQQQIEELKNG